MAAMMFSRSMVASSRATVFSGFLETLAVVTFPELLGILHGILQLVPWFVLVIVIDLFN